ALLRPSLPLHAALFPYTTLFRSPQRRRSPPWPRRTQVPLLLPRADLEQDGGEGGGVRETHPAVGGAGRAVEVVDIQRHHRRDIRSEEHTSELQSRVDVVCCLLPE